MENLIEIKNRDQIRNYLDKVLRTSLEKIIFSSKTSQNWPFNSTHTQFRIMLMLNGHFRYDIFLKDKVKTIVLAPETALVIPPGSLASPHKEHFDNGSMLTLVFWNQYLRFLVTNKNPPEKNCHYWYHTNNPLRGTLSILRALSELMAHKSDSAELRMLVSALLYTCREELQNDASPKLGKAQQTYYAVKNHMRENLHLPINRANIAATFKLSPSHISKLFARFDKSSFNACLLNMRLANAVELLQSFDLSIDEIAEHCGYQDTGYFIKSFKKIHGITPGEFRKKYPQD